MKILLSPVKARVQRKSGYASPQTKGRTQDGSGLLLSEKTLSIGLMNIVLLIPN